VVEATAIAWTRRNRRGETPVIHCETGIGSGKKRAGAPGCRGHCLLATPWNRWGANWFAWSRDRSAAEAVTDSVAFTAPLKRPFHTKREFFRKL